MVNKPDAEKVLWIVEDYGATESRKMPPEMQGEKRNEKYK